MSLYDCLRPSFYPESSEEREKERGKAILMDVLKTRVNDYVSRGGEKCDKWKDVWMCEMKKKRRRIILTSNAPFHME